MTKVRIPRNEDQLLGLLLRINKKHESDKKKSLLNGAVSMDRLIEKLKNVQDLKDHKFDKSIFDQQKNYSKKKDLRFISKEIQSIRNLLLAIYPDEPRVIEEWGFKTED